MSQVGLFEDPAERDRRLAHKWLGNMCPACKAPAGEECGPGGRIHGMRTRFARPGVYMSEADDLKDKPVTHG